MSDFDEIRTLASAMGEAGHGIMQATIGRELFLREFAEIAREIHRPITYTALLAGMNGPGGHRGPLEASQKLCDEGLDLPANQDRLVADAEGIDAVIVNGTVIRRENQDQVTPEGSLPGKLLRHGRAKP